MNSFVAIIRRALLFSQGGWELGWLGLLIALTLLPATLAFAAHPLITEDTGTQGQGNRQLELTLEYGHDEAADAEEDAADLAAVFSYGLRDNLDLICCRFLLRAQIPWRMGRRRRCKGSAISVSMPSGGFMKKGR